MLDMFSNKQKYTILSKTGYTGSDQGDEMEAFMQSKPEARSLVQRLERKAKSMQGSPTIAPENKTIGMAEGGGVESISSGGFGPDANIGPNDGPVFQVVNPGSASGVPITMAADEGGYTGYMTRSSGLSPSTSVATPNYAYVTPQADQEIQTGPDQAATTAGFETIGTAAQATAPQTAQVSTFAPSTVAPAVKAATEATTAQQGVVSQQAQVDAAQQDESAVSNLTAAQGAAVLMDNPVQRKIEADPVTGQSELISPAANAETASKFNEEIQAATATPTKQATVAGQLESLMADFEGGETPAWAAGSMRTAMATLSARGLGASSMAGQAVVQAAMEAALPIAQIDAQVQAQFEVQNLSNRQQRAMLAAQQRATFMGMEFDQAFQTRVANAAKISDIANMNFTAEQQVALENSRAANTMSLANLSNDQAMVMSEASALANLDMANLNNRQQAAVQNAQSFLGMEMSNLNNRQQTEMFRAQQNVQALFTDQAAENAASQFNSASENQTNQFFADLQANVSKFNADQKNAISQFDTSAVNATYQFNVAQDNAFKQFMISNSLVVAQANAKWRQTAATLNQSAANERALYVAKEQNALTQAEIDEIWQRERDEMDYVFNAYQNDQDRANNIVVQKISADGTLDAAKLQAEIGANQEIAKAVFDWLYD